MKRHTIAVVLLLAAAGGMGAATTQDQEKSYLVTVIAESGGPIANLTAKDFIVREDNEVRTVVSAERPAFPLVVSLLVDMTAPPLETNMLPRDLRTGVAAFVSALRAAQPGSQIALVEVGGGAVTSADFDAAPAALDAAVQRLFPAHPSDAIVLEAIGQAAKSLAVKPTPRRAIVIVDFNSSESLSEATMKRMTTELQQSGATVWSVSVRLPRSSSSRREGALNLITRESGGMRLVAGASSGLEAQLKKVAGSLASQYLVNFTRPAGAPMKPLRIETAQGHKVHVSPMSR
ncbi:MAG: hypothetical protein WD690_06420 [Vicinamibacterales bacterium]